jgi:hypothetical protein
MNQRASAAADERRCTPIFNGDGLVSRGVHLRLSAFIGG